MDWQYPPPELHLSSLSSNPPMKLSYAYIPSSDSGMDAMAKDKSSLARGQVEASVPTFSLIYIISLTWNFVGYFVGCPRSL